MSKKKNTIIISFLLAVVMAFSCTACETATTVHAAELSADYQRKATKTGEVTEEFQAAMADFSMELFRGLITKDEENDLISPLSAVLCLAMTANGTDGETRAQMEKAFGMDIETLNECLYAYTSSLYTAKDCKVNIADSIWFRDDKDALHVNEEFLQTNADWYDAQIYASPFDDTTLKDVNNWCKKHTDGMIDSILDRIEGDDVMYLINALVFDAKWEEPYEKSDIREDQFRNYGKSTAKVNYLHSSEGIYLEGDDGEIGFAKKYAGGAYSIVGILPKDSADIYDYVDSLTGEKWRALWNGKTQEAVNVKMPEFTYSAKMRLNDVLKSMGMTDLFDAGKADFTKLGASSEGNLYCGFVEQKTFIQVDRNGTKAAAVTVAGVKGEGCAEMPKVVILDRPFVYAIVDNATGLPLFLGAVTNLGG